MATLKQISDILKKTEQSQRVLEEASEGFQIIREDEATGAEETLTIDKLTAAGDISPVIRLVDSTIYTAIQRRASDIHIETQDDSAVHEVPHRRRAHAGDAADRRKSTARPSSRASR